MFGAGMTTSLTGMQAAVGVATGKLGIMQAAVAALGSPMGVAALAAAGVTAGIIALSLASKNNASDLEKNKKAIEEFTEELEESQKIRDAIEERRQEALETSFAEIDNTERQISSLEELVDANGKVKEGYEDKAAALAEQINSVIPNAISMTEDESGAYLKVADSIDLMIAKKKINALIDANQESYANALKESREAADKYSEALENQKVAHENLQKATSDTTSKQEIYDINLKKAQETANEADKAVEELAKQYEESINIITEQNNLLTASQSESTEEINNAIASQGVALKQYTADQLEEADKQLQNEKEKYDNLKRLYQDFNNEYTKSQLDAQKDVVEKAQAIRDNAYAEAEQASKAAGEAEVNAMINGISGLTETLKSEMKKTVDTAVEAANSIEQDMQQSGINAILGFAQGLQHQPSINKVINSAISLGTLAIVNLNKALDEHSPSKKTEKSGEDFDEGLAIGVEKNKGSVMESVEDLSQEALDIANKSSSDYKEIGELYGENYLSGLETMLDGTVELIEKNTDTMIKTYEKSMEEQTDASVKEIEAQTDAQVEAIDDQISKLKDVKDKAQKEANKEEIKQKEKEKKQIKEYSKERIQQIKDDAKEQTNAYKKGMQTLEKAGIDIIKKASSDIEKEYKKRQDAIVEQFQSQKDEILSLQDSLYSKTSEYGELFHYDEETGEMLLNDLTKNTQAVEQYYNSLEELSNIEGISDGFVKMIATEYDVEEGTKLLNELLKMSDTRLQSYAAEWDKLQEVSSKGSQSFLEEELNVIDTSFNQAMEKLANDMPVFTKEALNNAINEIATIFPEKYAELIAIDPNFFDNMINTLNAEILGSISQKEGVVVPVKTEVGDIAQQVTEQTPAVQQAGSELTISIAETVENNGDEVVDAVDNVSKDSVQAMESYKPDFKEVGADYIDMLTEGMKSKWSTAVSVAGDIARSLKEELEEVASFSVKSNEEAMTARQLVESAEPSLLHSLYNDMLSAVEIQQSRVAAASASYITNNNQSSTVENNMGDINFNIAEVKGNSADRSVDKLMQQAEFYRRQRNLAVGVR